MRFEWDEEKNQGNIQKHGFDFADVAQVFDLPVPRIFDDRRDYGEDRWIATGFWQDLIVVVVYTQSEEEVVRIISFRKANRHERQRFEKFFADRLG